jgi:hypothetical protein
MYRDMLLPGSAQTILRLAAPVYRMTGLTRTLTSVASAPSSIPSSGTATTAATATPTPASIPTPSDSVSNTTSKNESKGIIMNTPSSSHAPSIPLISSSSSLGGGNEPTSQHSNNEQVHIPLVSSPSEELLTTVPLSTSPPLSSSNASLIDTTNASSSEPISTSTLLPVPSITTNNNGANGGDDGGNEEEVFHFDFSESMDDKLNTSDNGTRRSSGATSVTPDRTISGAQVTINSTNSYGGVRQTRLSSMSDEAISSLIAHLSLARRRERGYDVGRWVHIQKILLEQLIQSAKYLSDRRLTAAATGYLLRALHQSLDRDYQKSLAADLWSITRMLPLNTCVDLTGIPVLVRMVPIPLSSSMMPHQHDNSNNDGDVFFFRPSDTSSPSVAASPKKLVYVANDVIDINVTLSNPYKCEIIIQRITLSTSGVPFEPFASSLQLGAETYNQRLTLSGRVLAAGKLSIRGVHIRTFNIMCEHLINDIGIGVVPLTPLSDSVDGDKERRSNEYDMRDITIVAPLPYIGVRHESLTHNNNNNDSMLIGEDRWMTLLIDNIGDITIDYIDILMQERYAVNTAIAQELYYDEDHHTDSDDDLDTPSLTLPRHTHYNKDNDMKRQQSLSSSSSSRGLVDDEAELARGRERAARRRARRTHKRLQWDMKAVAAQLPLAIQSSLRVPFRIKAHPAWYPPISFSLPLPPRPAFVLVDLIR